MRNHSPLLVWALASLLVVSVVLWHPTALFPEKQGLSSWKAAKAVFYVAVVVLVAVSTCRLRRELQESWRGHFDRLNKAAMRIRDTVP